MSGNLALAAPDVLVLGDGPAATAFGGAAARAGASVVMVGPGTAWAPTYSAWADTLPQGVLDAATEERWTHAEVHLDGAIRTLARPYVKLDVVALRAHLREAARSAGVVERVGRAVEIDASQAMSRVRLGEGDELAARLVVDARGAGATGGRATRWQTAHGRLVDLAPGSARLDLLRWMDFSPSDEAGPPSFLYALPLGGERLFVEETVLVGAEVEDGLLAARLDRRLARMGLRVGAVHAVERCRIPMNLPLPTVDAALLPFGSAAGMVHPATGFMVARCLAEAGPLADVVVAALRCGSGRDAARAGWSALWTPERRVARALHLYGAEVLSGMTGDELRLFFRHFFGLPETRWRAFLDGADAGTTASTMLELFARAPTRVRACLVSRAFFPAPFARLPSPDVLSSLPEVS